MRIQCLCGHMIYDVGDSEPAKGYVISDRELDALVSFTGGIRERGEDYAREFYRGFGTRVEFRTVYQCPACGRLLLESADHSFAFFSPEGHEEKSLLDFSSQPEE